MTDERQGLPSASSMDRVLHCPGSCQAERGLPDPKPEDVTVAGTAIHDAFQTGDEQHLGMTEKEILENLKRVERDALEQWQSEISENKI